MNKQIELWITKKNNDFLVMQEVGNVNDKPEVVASYATLEQAKSYCEMRTGKKW